MKQPSKKVLIDQLIDSTENMEVGIDTHGRIVSRCKDRTFPGVYVDHEMHPFEGCNFIALDKEDAQNILDMLNEAITRLESGTRSDNDVEVFGDKAISYERLIDALDLTIWNSSKKEEDEKTKEE